MHRPGLLLGYADGSRTIVVEAGVCELSPKTATPVRYIVTELITNAAKHGAGDILVRLDNRAGQYSLSVRDGGPGLPDSFDPGLNAGSGMRIVTALVKQIGGEMHTVSFKPASGACFEIAFSAEEKDAECNSIDHPGCPERLSST